MISQVYLKETAHILSYMMTWEANITKEIYLGDSYQFDKLYDPNNAFSSLGGSKESPLEYTFQETGITQFNFNLYGLKNNAFAKRKLYIQGDKINEFYFESQINEIILSTCSVYATKGQKTNFKLLMTSHSFEIRSIDHYLDGSNTEIKSSITAKFIPDPTQKEQSEPVMVNSDSPLKMNRRHLINAPAAKILQLSIDHNQCKIGDWIEIKTIDKGLAKINTGSNVDVIMNGKKTRAINGYLLSSIMGDFLRLECIQISPKIIFTDTMRVGKFIVM